METQVLFGDGSEVQKPERFNAQRENEKKKGNEQEAQKDKEPPPPGPGVPNCRV